MRRFDCADVAENQAKTVASSANSLTSSPPANITPSRQNSQPTGLRGCREAIRAPTAP
jgi:hypothetical protein